MRRQRLAAAAFAAAALVASPLAAPAASAPPAPLAPAPADGGEGGSKGLQVPVKEGVLPNGLKVLVVERHEAPVVSCVVKFRVGGVDEKVGQTGIAHILEHMLFKGTDVWGTTDYAAEKPLLDRTERLYHEILAAREALPLEIRRHTEVLDDIVRVSHALALAEAAPPERRDAAAAAALAEEAKPLLALDPSVQRVFDLEREFCRVQEEADRFVVDDEDWQILERNGAWGLNASTGADSTQYFYSLPANRLELWALVESGRMRHPVFRQFYKERDVIMEERRMRVDNNPNGVMWEQLNAAAYTAHPYGSPVIGWASDIARVSRSQVEAFFRKHYAPNRAVACVVGDVKFEAVMDLMRRYFGDIPRQPDPEPVVTREPPQLGERRITAKVQNLRVPQVALMFHRPALGHPDMFALDILSGVLSSGNTGRLDKSLWEKRIGRIFAGNQDTLYPGTFVFVGTPLPGKTLEDVEKEIGEQIARLRSEPVTDAEFAKVRNQNAASLVRGMQSGMDLAQTLTTYEILHGWDFINTYMERSAKVTKEDVMRVAAKYLHDDNRTVIHLLPAPAADAPEGNGK
ncbi:MAG: insulinase family protein [Planctomycetes bacterium]|nr:insulinase family protein [Planctomycetota bacterium]